MSFTAVVFVLDPLTPMGITMRENDPGTEEGPTPEGAP